jgi:hypothetical protein
MDPHQKEKASVEDLFKRLKADLERDFNARAPCVHPIALPKPKKPTGKRKASIGRGQAVGRRGSASNTD